MQAAQPQKFHRLGTQGSIFYGGEARAGVHLQDGCLFDETGKDLFHAYRVDPDRRMYKNILIWLDHNGYAMNIEMRNEIVKAINLRNAEAEMEKRRIAMLAQQKAELEAMEIELERDRRARSVRGPIPSAPEQKAREDLQLTSLEASVLGQLFAEDDEEDTGLPPVLASDEEDDDDFPAMDDEPPVQKAVVVTKKAAVKKK